MIAIDIPMPVDCRECALNTYYPLSGETRCRACNGTLAENFQAIPWEGRPEWCPLIDLSRLEDDGK